MSGGTPGRRPGAIWRVTPEGATAVAFGPTAADRHAVYVTTIGGTMTVPPDELEPAKLVRVEVGPPGAA